MKLTGNEPAHPVIDGTGRVYSGMDVRLHIAAQMMASLMIRDKEDFDFEYWAGHALDAADELIKSYNKTAGAGE